MMPIEEFKEAFGIEKLPEEDGGLYQTLGGFVTIHFEKIPSLGDHFDWGDLRFEVVDMDYNRVDKLLVAQKIGCWAMLIEFWILSDRLCSKIV